jgi:glutamate-5-semialdehyde dehydrogenase
MSDEQRARAEVEAKARAAKAASRRLATVGTRAKNDALRAMAEALRERAGEILDANARDLALAADKGVPPHMRDRLALNEKRVAGLHEGLRQVADLPDPIGTVLGGWRRPNGLQINKVRVPLGVLGIIYESRPNVTVDAAALALKSGNAAVLRGGSEAIHSNTALTRVISEAAERAGIPAGAISLIENTDRAAVRHLMTLNGLIDCLIPRGGASLIETVVKNATVPVIETGTGNCHVYIHGGADMDVAAKIVLNAKCSRPSVCNAAETLLIDHEVAVPWGVVRRLDGTTYENSFGTILQQLHAAGVEIRGCPTTREIAGTQAVGVPVTPATDADYFTEFNDLTLAVKVVASLEEAIDHINHYGTRHSEAIVTRDYAAAQRFADEVDAAAVYVNASTRFTDGYEFGFGAEIGISNQKLHARGPMGLEELTTVKYVVRGDGQVRE